MALQTHPTSVGPVFVLRPARQASIRRIAGDDTIWSSPLIRWPVCRSAVRGSWPRANTAYSNVQRVAEAGKSASSQAKATFGRKAYVTSPVFDGSGRNAYLAW